MSYYKVYRWSKSKFHELVIKQIGHFPDITSLGLCVQKIKK